MKKYPHSRKCVCWSSKRAREDWYVNAPEFSNCFWTYMRHCQRPHTLLEIATLLNLSISAITAIEKKALKKLKKRIKRFKIDNRTF